MSAADKNITIEFKAKGDKDLIDAFKQLATAQAKYNNVSKATAAQSTRLNSATTSLIAKLTAQGKSFKDLVIKSDVIITCLPSPASVNNVINSLIPHISSSHLWIEMSTTDEQQMKYLSRLIFDKKAEVIEAPITGGQHRAESGNISVFVGGTRKSFNRSFPILSCLGHQILLWMLSW